MTCIVKRKDPKSGNTYAYSSRSYRDPDTGKVKAEEIHLGRIDPETGELMPKASGGKRIRSASDRQLGLASESAQERIRELEEGIAQLEFEAGVTKASMCAIAVIVDRYRDDVGASG